TCNPDPDQWEGTQVRDHVLTEGHEKIGISEHRGQGNGDLLHEVLCQCLFHEHLVQEFFQIGNFPYCHNPENPPLDRVPAVTCEIIAKLLEEPEKENI